MTNPCAQFIGVVGEPTVAVSVVRGLLDMVEQSGVPRAELLRAAGLRSSLLDATDGRVAYSEIDRVCELALDFTADPALGLHWCETMSAVTFNPLSNLIAHSANLRQGFESLTAFHRVLTDRARYQLVEHGDLVTVRCEPMGTGSLRVQRLATEMLVMGIFRLVRSFCMHAPLPRVAFEYAAPSYAPEYMRAFRGAVQFDQAFTGVVFDRELMDMPSPDKDEDLHVALRGVAERRILRLTQCAPYAARVRELLVRKGPSCRADMDTVARSLGLSVRSLRRRLADEEVSYNDVVTDALTIVAKQLLREKQRSIQETAYDMGFSDTSAFHRAFKRWTGMTPQVFRKLELGRHDPARLDSDHLAADLSSRN